MKKMKKLFAMLIAMVMVLGMSMSVFCSASKRNYYDYSTHNTSGENTYEIYSFSMLPLVKVAQLLSKLLPQLSRMPKYRRLKLRTDMLQKHLII